MKIPFIEPVVFLFLWVIALTAWPVQGAAVDCYAGNTWALLDSKKELAAASDITLAKYPDCDEATVDEKIVQVYRADGTGENQDEAYVKVLTEKGKRDRRTLTLGFMLPYSTVSVEKMEVIKPSGTAVPVDIAANSKETIDPGQMQSNIYDPNEKALLVNIPGVEIGDVVHWVTRTIILRPIIPGEFADGNLFEGEGYIRHMEYEVHAPLDRPLKKIVVRDEIPGTVHYTTQADDVNKTLIHRWDVTNVPRMFSEPSMPSYAETLQRILVSTTPDWQSVSKWYWDLSKSHLDATTPELKKTVAELTAKAKTDMDKVKALFYYVSQKIRYMGLTPEKDRPGFEPHDVCVTFGKQYGVCRDKAALLVAMLRTAGLNAYPVLVSVGTKKDKDVPDAGFNHAIVAVELKKGEYTLMDPTDEHARDILPLYDGDQSYLVARPEGEDLKISAIKSPEENLMRIKTTGTLSAGGVLQAKSELWFGGANDDTYRNGFSHMKPDDRRRYFQKCLKNAMPGAKLISLTLTPENMTDVSNEIKAEMEFTVEGMTATGNGKSVVSLPWIGNDLGVVNFILKGTGLDKRKYPLQTEVACGLQEEISLKLGDGFAGAELTPTFLPIDDDCMNYRQNVEVKNGALECSRDLKLKVVEFTPAQYAQLKQTLKNMEYDSRKAPVLTMSPNALAKASDTTDLAAMPPVESNAAILDVHKELNVTDAHTAVYKVKYTKRILTYAGKVREAEIKLNFDPACEDAKLIRGTVISKTGERQEISKNEINVMDAEWSASAKRYTGGKILVANLPGVDIGSTIEVEYEITMKDKPYIAGFESFQLADQLQQKSFQLTAPADLKIEKMVTDGSPIEAADPAGAKGTQSFVWNVKNMKALAAESQLPPDWVCTPGVTYFAGDTKTYLKDLRSIMEKRAQSAAKAGELARQIDSQSKDKLEAVKGIRDFVAKSIRLAGPSSFTDLPLNELSTADTTLADGYGHAADRAILLHAMLTAAGFQPEFVLASNLPAVDGIRKIATSFPLPENFNAPLVKLAVDGVTYYLNDTDQYARLGSTAHHGKLGIDLASQNYEVIEAAKDCQDKTETVYTLSLADDGKMRLGVSLHYYGEEYNKKNRYFSELRPEERRRYYQEVVSKVAQGARPVGDLTDRFDTYPGTEQFTVELDHYAVVDGNYLYFDLPFTPSLFQLPGGDQRSLPFMLSQAQTNSVRTEIELPPSFQNVVISSKSENLDAPLGSGKVRMTSSNEAGKWVMTDEFETMPAVIGPKDYPAMLKVESMLERKSGKVFLLQKE